MITTTTQDGRAVFVSSFGFEAERRAVGNDAVGQDSVLALEELDRRLTAGETVAQIWATCYDPVTGEGLDPSMANLLRETPEARGWSR